MTVDTAPESRFQAPQQERNEDCGRASTCNPMTTALIAWPPLLGAIGVEAPPGYPQLSPQVTPPGQTQA